jgi:hypothetical protein
MKTIDLTRKNRTVQKPIERNKNFFTLEKFPFSEIKYLVPWAQYENIVTVVNNHDKIKNVNNRNPLNVFSKKEQAIKKEHLYNF